MYTDSRVCSVPWTNRGNQSKYTFHLKTSRVNTLHSPNCQGREAISIHWVSCGQCGACIHFNMLILFHTAFQILKSPILWRIPNAIALGETGKFSCTRRSVSAVNTMVSAVLSSRSAVLLFKPYSDVPCHHLFEWVVAHCLYFSDSLSRTKCTCSGTVTLANFASNCKKIYFRPQSELHRTPDLHQSRDAEPEAGAAGACLLQKQRRGLCSPVQRPLPASRCRSACPPQSAHASTCLCLRNTGPN